MEMKKSAFDTSPGERERQNSAGVNYAFDEKGGECLNVFHEN